MIRKLRTYVTVSCVLIGLAALWTGCPLGQIVVFQDANLEAAVRGALGKPFGFLTRGDLLELRRLDAQSLQIRDLSGLEFATNLTWLNLAINRVTDITPLTSLVNLEVLNLDCNELFELSALAGLLNLRWVSLCGNDVVEVGDLITNAVNSGLGPNDTVIVGCEIEISDPEGLAQLLAFGVEVLCCEEITCGDDSGGDSSA